MSINLSIPEAAEAAELKPRITVVGVGGAGGNAVNNMIRLDLAGVEYLVCNTDAQALRQSRADRRIQLGTNITQGLGAGSRPDIGRQAAEEAIEEITNDLRGINMAFIAAGMGGGTGTGAAPVIARACRDLGILTVGVVTKPFQFEGSHRMRLADTGIQDLEQYVDTLIIIPNQNLFRIANEKTTFADAFAMADDVLYSGVRGVTDLMVMPGLINLDFADVRAVMGEMGKAMMGTGEASGERRALDAAEAAIANPLLDDASMKGAKGVLINITGGPDMTLFEVDEAANRIRAEVDEEAFIIFGAAFDQGIEGKLRVSVVATGIDSEAAQRPLPMLGEPRIRATARPPVAKEKVPAAILVPKAEPAPVVAEVAPAAAVAATPASAEAPIAAAAVVEAPAAAPSPVAAPVAAEAEVAEWAALASMASASAPAQEPAAAPAAVATPVAPAPAPAPAAAIPPAPARRPAAVHELKRPVAMPAVGAGDAFIPPAPVEATGETRIAHADPFAQADMVNPPKEAREAKAEAPRPAPPVAAPAAAQPAPAQPAAKPRALSLFERVTGVHRARAQASAEPAAARPAAAGPVASRLGGVALQDRPAPQRVEDDLLDIPAFLRRQAN